VQLEGTSALEETVNNHLTAMSQQQSVKKWYTVTTVNTQTKRIRAFATIYYRRQGDYVIVVVCLSVCQLSTSRKNIKTDLHEIFREGWQ